MFKEKYRKINEQISADKELTHKIISSVDENKGISNNRKQTHGKPVLILVAILVIVMTVTPVLAVNQPAIYNLMYLVSPTVAQYFKPIQKSSESNDIKMEVISTYIHDNVVDIYITMQDLVGNRIDETTDVFDSYSINRSFDGSATCQNIGYDEQTRTATFLISITDWSKKNIIGDKITFSVSKFISGKQEYLDIPISFDLTNINKIQSTNIIETNGGSGAKYKEYVSDFNNEVKSLVPSDPTNFPIGGIEFTGIGYIDNMLHIQTAVKNNLTNDNHGYFFLKDKDGIKVDLDYSFSYIVNPYPDNSITYSQDVFDIPQLDIGKYSLFGDFWVSTIFTQGDWQVTFPIE